MKILLLKFLSPFYIREKEKMPKRIVPGTQYALETMYIYAYKKYVSIIDYVDDFSRCLMYKIQQEQ